MPRTLIERLLHYVEELNDAGPRGEGWQSDELMELIREAKEFVAATPLSDTQADLVGRLRARQQVSLSWPDAALRLIDTLNAERIEAASALTSSQARIEELERERGHLTEMIGGAALELPDGLFGEPLAEAVRALSTRLKEAEKALESVRRRVKNARGAIESNQVVDKDVHGSLTVVLETIDRALKGEA